MIIRRIDQLLKIFAILIICVDNGLMSTIPHDDPTTRCPERTNKTGIYMYSDKKLCNVFHECFCNDGNESYCSFVKSNVCPLGKVFYNLTSKCEPIEMHGCDSLYLQWVNSSNEQSLEQDDVYAQAKSKSDVPLESNNVGGISEFVCPYGSNERFADPQICNVFHVCVSRGDQTYDQPFLCPFSSVFRVIDSNTMYCDKKNINDCREKAFYRSAEDELFSFSKKSDLLLIEETHNVTECDSNEIYEDELYCNTYHVCKGKIDKHYICENNLLFNPLSLMCDYPINVVCSFKQIFKKEDVRLKQPQAQPQLSQHNQQQQQQEQPQPQEVEVKIKEKVEFTKPVEQPIEQQLEPVAEAQIAPVESLVARNFSYPHAPLINNIIQRKIFGFKIDLKCPKGAKNYLFPDTHFCNVFHHCDGSQGNILLCERGQAFDPFANGPEASGVCNFENLVDCEGKFILTEYGKRAGQPVKLNYPSQTEIENNNNNFKETNIYKSNDLKPIDNENTREELISGIKFDCRSKPNGHWRDYRYCDVFHACISNEQKKTYSCAQLGERIYFNETTKRCEFLKYNPNACPSNMFFNQVPQTQLISKTLDEPNESWRYFIRARENFKCTGVDGVLRPDGFYASRWCNVFYRCFLGIRTEFLCPKMLSSDRLWWIQHSSSQETPQTSAACVWPCETKKQCNSPGGTIVQTENGTYAESIIETERIWRSSSCGEEKLGNNDIFKISDTSFSCNGLTEGSFYSSKYCNIFHRCTSGKRKDFRCPRATNSPYDLWWNPVTSQCDWPCRVKCANAVYGSPKSSFDIRKEDYYLNEAECRRAQYETVDLTPTVLKFETAKKFAKKMIERPFPDEFICPGIGLFPSEKYCNVYYECRIYNKLAQAAYFCADGHFDPDSKSCTEKPCAYKPALLFPLISIEDMNPPEEVSCSYKLTPYVLHSNRFCNVYYMCSGRSAKAQTYRCFDKQTLTDGVYSRELGRCVSKADETCFGETYIAKPKYQSSPVAYQRLSDLNPLACRSDQQYLAEHDKYCNLFHSCILGKYQMFACVAIGAYDKASFFYYTNGDCAAPNLDQCGPNKSIYPYGKLFPESVSQFRMVSNANVTTTSATPSYGAIPLKKNIQSSPKCATEDEFVAVHNKYCNIYFECHSGNLLTFVCVDTVSGNTTAIFDSKSKKCASYNSNDCPSNVLYNPEIEEEPVEQTTELPVIQEASKKSPQVENSFVVESNFSCLGLKDAYYESEYCNVYYRCISGKRIDVRCSSGKMFGSTVEYDLWWFNQNATFNASNPLEFSGDDSLAQCDFPCKVKCSKKIWTEVGQQQVWSEIQSKDLELHPECSQQPAKNENKNLVDLMPIKEALKVEEHHEIVNSNNVNNNVNTNSNMNNNINSINNHNNNNEVLNNKPFRLDNNKFTMANLKQKIKSILNNKESSLQNEKFIWSDWQ